MTKLVINSLQIRLPSITIHRNLRVASIDLVSFARVRFFVSKKGPQAPKSLQKGLRTNFTADKGPDGVGVLGSAGSCAGLKSWRGQTERDIESGFLSYEPLLRENMHTKRCRKIAFILDEGTVLRGSSGVLATFAAPKSMDLRANGAHVRDEVLPGDALTPGQHYPIQKPAVVHRWWYR